MEQYNLIERTVRLTAKTGLFFACADGEYSAKEQAFIEAFIENLAKEEDPGRINALLDDVLASTYTLDEIADETNGLLAEFDPNSADLVRRMLKAFALDVIEADGRQADAEAEAFERWAQAIGA